MKAFWKRSVVLAIDFAHNYRYDPFLRTEINIIVLQAAFAAFLLGVVAVIANQVYHDAASAVSQGIAAALQPHSSPTSVGTSVVDVLNYTRSRTVLLAAGMVVVVTTLFTYIITRMALTPTRNALESQKQFIGNVAHELRTPLAVAKTNMEVGLLASALDKDTRRIFRETVDELDRMSEILNNLLTLSAFTRPERVEFSGVDLALIVREVISKLRGLAESKNLEVEMRVGEDRTVWGNVAALEQIVMNLIKNAIFYTGSGGRVVATIESIYPDQMELRVQDSGRGIARKDLFRIFEPYYRGDPARRRDGGGSGLGLTIVSELVKLHNGKITVRSAEGRGTTVTLLLPVSKRGKGGRRKGERPRDDISEIAVDFSHNSVRG